MVTAPGGSNMMQGLQLYGSADSGYGVTIAGFHSSTLESGKRLSDLEQRLGTLDHFAVFEDNGYVTFLGATDPDPAVASTNRARVSVYRREPHKFFQDLQKFLSGIKATKIKAMSLSGSLGSIALTVLYYA